MKLSFAYHASGAFALVIAAPLAAQQGSEVVPAQMDDDAIIVTALPLPRAQRGYGGIVLDQTSLENTSSNRLEDALAKVPGLQQFRRSDSRSANPSAQGITLRAIGGNAASRTLILLDGVPQADAFFGYVPFTALPIEAIGSARITRGSGAGAFGAGAVAGVIELSSRAPNTRAPLNVGFAAGSRNSFEANVGAAMRLGAGTVMIDARHDRGAGFFTAPPEQRVSTSVPARYRASSVALSAAVPVNETTALFARIALYRDDRTLRFGGADSAAQGIDASMRIVGRGRWQVEALGWVQARDFSTVVVSATTLRPTLNQRATPTAGWGGKVELRPPLPGDRLIRIGADVRAADGVAIEDVLAASGVRTLTRRAGGNNLVAGAFVEADTLFGPVSLTAGGRIDRWQLRNGAVLEVRGDGSVQSDTQFAARSGIIASWRGATAWTVGESVIARASAYSGFRVPTLNELYRGFAVFPVTTRANANLTPERLHGWDVGVQLLPFAGATVSLTAFDNRLSDAVANVTIGPNLRQRRNIKTIRARGIEAMVAIGAGSFAFDAGWAWTQSRLATDPGDSAAMPLNGLRPAQSPRHSGSMTAAWQNDRGTRLQVGLRHVGAQFEDDRNIDRLPATTTIDALARIGVGRRLSLSLRAENLLDARVVTRNAAGSIDLGIPRTLWLGLRWGG